MSKTSEVENLRERARLLGELGRHKEAIPLLHQALAFTPQDADLLCCLSSAHYHLREWKQALNFAEEAIAAEPQTAWAHALRSQIMVVRNRGREAVKSGEEAMRLAPYYADYLRPLFHAYVSCQRWKDAEKAAIRYREMRPDLPAPYEMLATVAQAKRRALEAASYLRQARVLDPTSPEIARRLALLELHRKRTPETFQRLYEAARLDPANTQAQKSLTDIGFNFASLPQLVLGIMGALVIALFDPTLRIKAGAPYLPVFLLITLPVLPVHRLRPEWLLSWQPDVRSLPLEMQAHLIRMWRRHWLSYGLAFCFFTLIYTIMAIVALGVIRLAIHAFQAWVMGKPF
jgi:tetratricopeptide (TPR) repeat protein